MIRSILAREVRSSAIACRIAWNDERWREKCDHGLPVAEDHHAAVLGLEDADHEVLPAAGTLSDF